MAATFTIPGIRTYTDLEQGTEEWFAVRRGMVTASVVGSLVTPTLKVSNNETSRSLTALLVAERITGWTDPNYVSDDMLRGRYDEVLARDLYSKTYQPVTEVGFIVRDLEGVQIGYSPDGLVGSDGLIECKSRRAKKHIATILADEVPAENMAQCQAGLLTSGRAWCDYLSYCGGLPMWRKRVHPDPAWQAAIIAAVQAFEESAATMTAAYLAAVEGLPATERISYDVEVEF